MPTVVEGTFVVKYEENVGPVNFLFESLRRFIM
jgi:hypothetical protein